MEFKVKNSLLLNVVIIILVFSQTCLSKLLRIDFMHMKSPLQTMLENGFTMRNINKLFERGGNDSIPLFRYMDSEFYGEVLIGHPGQKFKVIFDTTWANSWVPSVLCSVTDIACELHAKYNSKKSSQYKPDGRPIKILLNKSSLSGFLSNDLIHMGSKNVSSQTFAEMTNIPSSFILSKADGIFGLGFRRISYLDVPPFLDNMISEGVISKKIFSVYFNRDKSSMKGGTLLLGGSEKKHYIGNFTYVNLIAPDFWRIEVSSIHVKGSAKDFCNSSCPVIFDTGSTTISGPSKVISEISGLIQSRPSYLPGRYTVNCGDLSKLPALTFTIGGREFVLKARDYIQKISFPFVTTCLTVFEASDLPKPFENHWTLGASFMARFYTEFDAENNRIGLADIRM